MKSRKRVGANAPRNVTVCVDATKTMGREAFQGVAGYIRKTGCDWVLRSSAGNRLWLPTELDNLPFAELDGIISFSSDTATVDLIRKTGVCWVSFFDDPPDNSIPAVLSDNDAIGRLAARHLVELSLKNFFYYGTDLVSNSEARFRGFEAYLAEKNVGKPCQINVGVDEVVQSGAADRRKYLGRLGGKLQALTREGSGPVGVFAYSDYMGMTVIEACRAVGLAVPEKVAVVAVATDEIICELSVPPLTTIQQDARRIGREAAALLDLLLQGKAPKQRRIVVPPLGLKIRRSTDMVATEDPYVVKAVCIIRERFREKLEVEDLCAGQNISRRVFEQRFRQALGRSPYEEIMRTRLRHAKMLLAETTDTNLAIALECGFGGERRFNENFRNAEGMSPGEYRKHAAGHG